MRHLSFAGILGALCAVASLTGCAGSPTKGPEDALSVLNRELSMTLTEDVGTTTLTSGNATAGKSVLEEQGPMQLPEDRMSLSALAPQTWGTPSSRPPSLADIAPTRE